MTLEGQWNMKKFYETLGYVVLGELLVWPKCPKWLRRAVRGHQKLDFMDQRLVKNIDDGWPDDAIQFAMRQYEKDWPKPVL
jgi:hypothetical protein